MKYTKGDWVVIIKSTYSHKKDDIFQIDSIKNYKEIRSNKMKTIGYIPINHIRPATPEEIAKVTDKQEINYEIY